MSGTVWKKSGVISCINKKVTAFFPRRGPDFFTAREIVRKILVLIGHRYTVNLQPRAADLSTEKTFLAKKWVVFSRFPLISNNQTYNSLVRNLMRNSCIVRYLIFKSGWKSYECICMWICFNVMNFTIDSYFKFFIIFPSPEIISFITPA